MNSSSSSSPGKADAANPQPEQAGAKVVSPEPPAPPGKPKRRRTGVWTWGLLAVVLLAGGLWWASEENLWGELGRKAAMLWTPLVSFSETSDETHHDEQPEPTLEERILSLESALNDLRSEAASEAEARRSREAAIARVPGLHDAASAAASRLDALEDALDRLRRRVVLAETATTTQPVTPDRLWTQAVDQTLADHNADLDRLTAQWNRLDRSDTPPHMLGMVWSVERLSATINAGMPLGNALDAINALAPSLPPMDAVGVGGVLVALGRWQDRGVPTVDRLQREGGTRLLHPPESSWPSRENEHRHRENREIRESESRSSWWDDIWNHTQSLVRLQRISNTPPSQTAMSEETPLASPNPQSAPDPLREEFGLRLENGDVRAARDALRAASDRLTPAGKRWLQLAQEHLTALEHLTRLRALLLSALNRPNQQER